MNYHSYHFLKIWMTGVLLLCCAQADVEQARKLFQQKKYAEAEKILEEELNKPKPSLPALKMGIENALATGRMITAEKRAGTLLKAIENKNPHLVFTAAQLAWLTGEDDLALSRFLLFVKQSKNKSEQNRMALEYLLARGAYPDLYAQYIKMYGATDQAWDYGDQLMSRLFDNRQTSEILNSVDVMLQHFSDRDRNHYIAEKLVQILDVSGGVDEKRRVLELMGKYPLQSDNDIHSLLHRIWGALTPQERCEGLVKVIKTNNRALYEHIIGRMNDMRDVKDEAARIKLGQQYLGLEGIFKAGDSADYYRQYADVIADSPQVFNIEGKPILQAPQVATIINSVVAKSKDEEDAVNQLRELLYNFARHYLSEPQQAALFKKYLAQLDPNLFDDLIRLNKGNELDALMAQYKQQHSFSDYIYARWLVINEYIKAGKTQEALDACKDYMNANPGTWDVKHLSRYILNKKEIDDNAKIALLTELLQKGGTSFPLRSAVNHLSQTIKKDPKMAALKKDMNQNKSGSDPLMSAHVQMYNIKPNPSKPKRQIFDLMKKVLDEYNGRIPSYWSKVKNVREHLIFAMFDAHHNECRHHARYQWALLWAPHVKETGWAWDQMLRRVREHYHADRNKTLYTLCKLYASLLDQGESGSGSAWYDIGELEQPKGDSTVLFDKHYKLMKQYAFRYVDRQVNSWPVDVYFQQVEKVFQDAGEHVEPDRLHSFIHNAFYRTDEKHKLATATLDQMLKTYISRADEYKSYAVQDEAYLYGCLAKSGRPDATHAFLDQYIGMLNARPEPKRMEALLGLFEYANVFSPVLREYVLFSKIMPMAATMKPEDWRGVGVHYHVFDQIENHKRNTQNQAVQLKCDKLRDMLAAAELNRGYPCGHGVRHASYVRPALTQAFQDKEWELGLRGLHKYIGMIIQEGDWNRCYNSYFSPVKTTLESCEAYESLYLYADLMMTHVQHDREAAMRNLSTVKAEASRQIPGLLAVGRGDATYDLHMASQMLMLGNEARAWELTRPKLKTLIEKWVTLNIDYIAWAIEQMRKQKMYKEALDFCFTVLLKEFDYNADPMARISLIKGDIYRDMENYQAARIEYEGLRNNKRYKDTEPGREARYRLINLMILTKDYASAESQLERLLDAGSLKEQAEAYFLYSKMAFDQQEFRQSRDYLTDVFKRINDHVEGRLLEGELRLLLPRGLARTEVLIGNPMLKTVAIPGRELTLKLQDSNLAVARDGKIIPVIVQTTRGKDVEKLRLVASSDDPTLFQGMIRTVLGDAKPNNVQLELIGLDEVQYQIDPQFQQANNLSYPVKILEVKSDGELMASSGEILNEKERERQLMEQRMREAQGDVGSRRMADRDNKTVRPGSPIYIQIVDADRDMSSIPDKVQITLETSSGDRVTGFDISETEAHSGVFEGKVPTGTPYPMVITSDSEEGSDPYSIINKGKKGPWSSLADGRKPKWVEVDTMSSHELSKATITMSDLDNIRQVRLVGRLEQNDELIAVYPAETKAVKGGLTAEMKRNGHSDPNRIRNHLKWGADQTYWTPLPTYRRDDTKWQNRAGWFNTRLRGTFWLDEDREMEFKFLNKAAPWGWQSQYLYIDEKLLLGMNRVNDRDLRKTATVFLEQGLHHMEILAQDHWEKSHVIVGLKNEQGEFEPMGMKWFSTEANPKMAELLKPKESMTKTDDGFEVAFSQPRRYRALRWVFEDFAGNAITASDIVLTDATGNNVIPVSKDFSTASANSILEIAPGDQISISYDDQKRLSPDNPILNASLNASFYNAKVMMAFEEIITDERGEEVTVFSQAKRASPGTQLMIIVSDFDEDLTEERDQVDVKITTASGEELKLKALETSTDKGSRGTIPDHHAGVFMQTISFGDTTQGSTLGIKAGEEIKLVYLDKENTDPGVPIEREYTLEAAAADQPELLVYSTRVELEEDTSDEAQRKIERMRQKSDAPDNIKIYKATVYAGKPDMPDDSATPIPVSVRAPVLYQVVYPSRALHKDSILSMQVTAESDVKAAEAEGREPVILEVPMVLEKLSILAQKKGYPIVELDEQGNPIMIRRRGRAQQDEEFLFDPLLEKGIFSGVIRLQLGAPGDTPNDLVLNTSDEMAFDFVRQNERQDETRVPTIVVSGSDMLNLKIVNDEGADIMTRQLILRSDAQIELLDRGYTYENDTIHLGQNFNIRLTDPDQDVSDARDEVTMSVSTKSGDKIDLTLTETIPHSGQFTASLEPQYIKTAPEGQALTGDKTLMADFGDEVTFTYVDDKPLKGDQPLTATRKGQVHKGSSGQVVGFTKRFKDPEMAVKTRFLMAEALFEMAKDHRELKQEDLANEEIAEGKRILEEAMRDYPNTTLVAQGEFLLANLAQELENYEEAIGRYVNIISSWPDSEYAPRSQFKKGLCLEKMESYESACEEYVKLIYIYPESSLVADATARMGNYYYKQKNYEVAGKIFLQFQQNNPAHSLAPKSLFLAAQSFMKVEEEKIDPRTHDFSKVLDLFTMLIDQYLDENNLRPEAMYWLGDTMFKTKDYVKAYQTFKKLTWDYPASKWAKIARGRLTEDVFVDLEEEL